MEYEKFISNVVSVGGPVVKTLLQECLGHIKDKKDRKKLESKLDEILPNMPIGARKVMFEDKVFMIVISPIDEPEKYSILEEIDRIKKVIPKDKHDYLQKEINVTMSIIPNIYQKLLETHNKDFTEPLLKKLPEERRNIKNNLIEYHTSMFSMYDDGVKFGLITQAIDQDHPPTPQS